MIRAIIFDCFGVLTTDGWLAFKHKYFEHDSFQDIKASELNRQADAGLISYQEYIKEVAALAKVDLSEAMKVMDGHVRNDELFQYIRDDLKSTYKIGLLSNAADNYLSQLFEPWQIALFDEVTLSYELGVVKPDSKMYQTIAMKLGFTEEECVFIDDRADFAQGACQVGMRAINFTSNNECKRQLETLLKEQSA